MKIGYLGPKGTFSHEAVKKYIKNLKDYEMIDFLSMEDIVKAVRHKELDEAVFPIENSIEGSINVTLDMLSFENDIQIKSEIVIDIHQNLMIKKEGTLEQIEWVLSHPQPIGQCRKFIETQIPNARVRCVYSTSQAAEEVANNEKPNLAAVGSLIAAEVYGLKVIKKDIQDENNNSTRFVVIGKNELKSTGKDKTSIVFSTEDKPGSLYRVLDIFNLWDINMTKIVSRPQKNELGKYIFFVDLLGHIDDDDVRDAIIMVKRKASFFKFLGSYPVFIRE